jgi:hypothetical protein
VLLRVSVLLDVTAVLLGEQCAANRRTIMCSLQGQAGRLLAPLDTEDGGIMMLQNIRNCLPDDSVSHPRTLECNVVSSVDSTVIK